MNNVYYDSFRKCYYSESEKPARKFWDTEHNAPVTIDDLFFEWINGVSEIDDFNAYVNQCLTHNGGTLIEITK